MSDAPVASREAVMDGNEAVASVAYRASEVVAIYPITPASAMGEHADDWAADAQQNVWGAVPSVVEMQSEGGAIAAVHGALQTGALATTFTSSQGLLLMIPSLFKLAGELTPLVVHVAARAVATHALSIFCEHSDVMACRQTGVALLASDSVQQAHDFACIAHAATLASRVPFIHFFDGFRTSHEVTQVRLLSDAELRQMLPNKLIDEHRARALNPDRPVVRGTAHNPDTYFQAREACNEFYRLCPQIVAHQMGRFADLTGRKYALVEYFGDLNAESVIVLMGSAVHTAREAARRLNARGERVGVLQVCLYRPFPTAEFMRALPKSVRRVAVLDRTKEPGATGEPLYLDVTAAIAEHRPDGERPQVIGGIYGLGSKEFTPEMVEGVFAELRAQAPKRHFSIGINDDVSHLSLPYESAASDKPAGLREAVFFGLGADGTVSANKNTIKILGQHTELYVQGYFVYDSKKSGAVTVSHLRFSDAQFQAPYLIRSADFVACHQFDLVERLDVIGMAQPGAVLLLNSPYTGAELWQHVSRAKQRQILEKRLRVYTVDAYRIASEAGLGRRINTVMQACFFALTDFMATDLALAEMKHAIEVTYGRKSAEVTQLNIAAVDAARAGLVAAPAPDAALLLASGVPPAPVNGAPDFVQRVTRALLAGNGDKLPVSAFPVDGTWPTGTSRYEKRNLATAIPVWDSKLCIQCNKCVLVCPHAALRAKIFPSSELADAPSAFKAVPWKAENPAETRYTLQVSPEDCTGCQLCVEVCPAKDKTNPQHRALEMSPHEAELRAQESACFDFFKGLPETDRRKVRLDVKGSQLLEPLFEFSGACSGCGETPYIKLVTQLFGDRALIANATGCSSIFGGNLPTTPYTTDAAGRGPAWANSLFEDNAEFGFGYRISVDALAEHARLLLVRLGPKLDGVLVDAILSAAQTSEAGIAEQRVRVATLERKLKALDDADARSLETLASYLVRRSVWLFGGDGWAYDIGFGGLDHVLACGRDVNVLVLDTEVYSNTGGQQSKATPLGAMAKFAAHGKTTPKKDLGLWAMSYGHVYVARIAFGAKDAQTVRALVEAESYPGPSLIIAYSHCIAHGYDLVHGLDQQRLAVESGIWPLYRFDPRRTEHGEPPLQLDSTPGKARVRDYMNNESRFKMVERLDKARYEELVAAAERDAVQRTEVYRAIAQLSLAANPPPARTQK
ncbi:MAG TPA: pyruvate:ferredoxin (flavodoxin) oxidoreductase [Polyangiaceae bacterium]